MASNSTEITDPSGQDPQLQWSAFKLVIVGAISLGLALMAIFAAATILGEK